MKLGEPPADEPPARIWRSLIALRPQRPMVYRLPCAPDVPLICQAPTSLEEGLAFDAADLAPEEIRSSRAKLEILGRALWTPTGPAFGSAADVGRLLDAEVDALAEEVAGILDRIAPTYARSNAAAWVDVLERGALHGSNIGDAMTLAACVDEHQRGTTPRPDRFWGLPLRELLDGHWMAFRAARRAADKLRAMTTKG